MQRCIVLSFAGVAIVVMIAVSVAAAQDVPPHVPLPDPPPCRCFGGGFVANDACPACAVGCRQYECSSTAP